MASWDLLTSFAVATLLFGYMPGPAIVYTAAQTLAFGRNGGLMAALGLHTGGYLHVIASALGLAVILTLVPTLFLAIKIAGACYLVWLGISIIRSGATSTDLPAIDRRNAKRAFAHSMLVEILNPKTALFYLAFLPQFVDPAAAWPAWVQFLVLGTVVNLTFSSADIATVMMTGEILKRLKQSGSAQKIIKWIGGSVLVVLGINLATSRA